ncbi:tyrosine-type recombinase/integrase [Sporosarcina sp. OR05]|uniref:tyrosine-type recombinase/integrase n=1 Tax=Sporosarcina sp. OR05 TaxID=2969819 RepID=UPI00352A489D
MTMKTKPQKHYLKKEPEVFHYTNASGEKLWGYRHRYYDALGKRREKSKQGLASEKIALRKLFEVKSDIVNGNVKIVDHSNLTVNEWFEQWYKENNRNWAVSTSRLRKIIIKNNIGPLIGKYKLSKLDRSTYIEKFINPMLDQYAKSTVEFYHAIFRIGINAAVENEIIGRNRFKRIPIADKEDEDVLDNYLTAEDLKTFLAHAKDVLELTDYTAIFLLAYTGMRKGEAQGLQWKDIDFVNKTIRIERTRDDFGTRKPKTKNSRRDIHISDILVEQLKKYRNWCVEQMFLHKRSLSAEDYVFINNSTEPIKVSRLYTALKTIYKELKVKTITLHGLRHTHATILLMSENRLPVIAIAQRLGNTPEMINKVYGHVVDEVKIEAVEVFERALNL